MVLYFNNVNMNVSNQLNFDEVMFLGFTIKISEFKF